MLDRLKNISFYQIPVGLLLILGTVFSVYTPDTFIFRMGARFAVQFMFICLGLGFLFLLLRVTSLMFLSFIAAAVMCIFLKGSFQEADSRAFYPKRNGGLMLKAAHFNVGSASQDYPTMIEKMLESDADLISVQELTPDWNLFLRQGLKQKYPHSKSVVRIDFRGLAFYSKYPLSRIDTFHFEDTPNIYGSVEVDSTYGELFFICSNTEPPVNTAAYDKIRRHLMQVAQIAKGFNAPVLTIGAYNTVPWSQELKAFRTTSGLQNGRRDFTPNFLTTSPKFLDVPTNHIFHSDELESVNFETLTDDDGSDLGILAEFQYKYFLRGSPKQFQ